MQLSFILAVVALLMIPAGAQAGTRVLKKETRSFDSCLAVIRETASTLGVAPINIVETNILRIVRFPTNDGSGKSILVTCSRPDNMMLINESW